MRTPRRHLATDGTPTWTVRYRPGIRRDDGVLVERSQTFEDEDVAHRFAELLDRVGAQRALAILKREAAGDGIPTLAAWFARWNMSRTGIEDDTRDKDRRMFDKVWSPALGDLPLDLVDREAVAAVVNSMAKTGNRGRPYSDKTVRNYHGLLSACLNAAVEAALVTRNPSRKMRLPRATEHEADEMRFLTHDEFWALHTKIPNHWQPLVLTLAGTGIRWGEAEALTVADVLPDGKLRLNKAAKGKTRRYLGPTKSPKSRRVITMPPEVIDALRPLAEGRPGNARLFTAPRGGPIRHRTFWYDIWRTAVADAGLDDPQPRIHDLRHSHASWLINQGWSIYVVSRRLGHASITTTANRYGHLDISIEAAAGRAAFASLVPQQAELPE